MPDRIYSNHTNPLAEWELEFFHSRGERVPWEKVYAGGRDVTDQPPETWPWPWSRYYAEGWRPWMPPASGGR